MKPLTVDRDLAGQMDDVRAPWDTEVKASLLSGSPSGGTIPVAGNPDGASTSSSPTDGAGCPGDDDGTEFGSVCSEDQLGSGSSEDGASEGGGAAAGGAAAGGASGGAAAGAAAARGGALGDEKKGMFAMLTPSRAENVLPRHRPAMPSLEAVRASAHYPLVMTPDPSTPNAVLYNGSRAPAQQLSMNFEGGAPTVVQVDSADFKGVVSVQIRNLETSHAPLFEGKKRTFHIAAQGVMKRPVRAAALCTGQEFNIPIHGGRSVEYIIETILRACAKTFSKTTNVDAHGETPYYFNPLAAAAQLINVSRPGEEPPLWEPYEDCRLMSPALAEADGSPLPAEKRRRWMDDPGNLESVKYEPGYVYTLHVWQHMVDFASYKISVANIISFDLTNTLCAQPLQIMSKNLDTGDYLYSMCVWHQRLLYPEADREDKAKRAAERRSRQLRAGANFVRGLWGRS